MLSWLIRKRHPSRAFISSRCVTLSSTSPQRAASSSSAAPPPRRSALFPALSRSFPSALFPAAFLLHAPRSARRLSCLHSCGAAQSARASMPGGTGGRLISPGTKEQMTPISGNSLDTAKARLVPVSQAPTGAALLGHVHSVNNQRKTTTASFPPVSFFSTVCTPSRSRKGKQCLLLSRLTSHRSEGDSSY